MKVRYLFPSHSPEETRNLAAKLVEQGSVKRILLQGQLGAGKTEFVRGICQALGVKDPISSPTFVLEHQYLCSGDLASRLGLETICHWDCYRLQGPVEDIELHEQLEDEKLLTVIEWPEKIDLPEILHLAKIYINIPQNDSKIAESTDSQLRVFSVELDTPVKDFEDYLESL